LIDKNSPAIEIKPSSPQQINLGDVISYHTAYGTIIHLAIEVNFDEQGVYCLARGDNNTHSDPLKMRFENVMGVVVAVIY